MILANPKVLAVERYFTLHIGSILCASLAAIDYIYRLNAIIDESLSGCGSNSHY